MNLDRAQVTGADHVVVLFQRPEDTLHYATPFTDQLVPLAFPFGQWFVAVCTVHNPVFTLVLLEKVTIGGTGVSFVRIYPAFGR